MDITQCSRRDRFGAPSLMVAGTSLIAASFGLARYGYGLFVPEFQKDLHLSTAQIGSFSSLSYVGYGFGLLICPALVRRRSARIAVLWSAVLVTVGIFVVAAASSAAVLATGVAVAGIGVGLAWPPFSNLAADHVDATRRPRVVSTISTGTSFGLILAAPLALIAGHAWHAVWVAFGAFAVLVLVLNAVTLPTSARPARASASRRGAPHARQLAVLATYSLAYGAIGATFFTFAIELAHTERDSRGSSILLWAIVGVTGLAAVRTGEVINRLGLRNGFSLLLAGMAAGLLCLGLLPTSVVILDAGAAVFGPFYMAGAAIVPRWSEHIDPSNPVRPHSLATGASAVGSIAGAAAAGALGSSAGLPTVFVTSAALAAITGLALRPAVPPRAQGAIPSA